MPDQNRRDSVQAYYDSIYDRLGIGAQRRYPNEEFCRFLGSTWLNSTTRAQRSSLRLLEVGCGSGANLWMAAREGFQAYGIDLSEKAVEVSRSVLASWGLEADLLTGNMISLPYPAAYFDVVCDVFSANCLDYSHFITFLGEVRRVLKQNGRFFFYTPSIASDAFTNHAPAKLLDAYTLDGIKRHDSPYFGNDYNFRFLDPDLTPQLFHDCGLHIEQLEAVGRTYRSRAEYFEFVVGVATKH